MTLVRKLQFIILIFIVMYSSADEVDNVIEGEISDMKDPASEISDISKEVQGIVFPEEKGPPARPPPKPSPQTAVVNMVGDKKYLPFVRGHVTLTQIENGPVVISGKVEGLPRSGLFAMHFHQRPVPTAGSCQVTGEHFNPRNSPRHGGPNSYIRHAGDMGNIVATNKGVAPVAKSDFLISLTPGGEDSVIGKSLVIHIRRDDLGKGPNRESGINGNSGTRIACGNVVLVDG